ncbi:RNA methyltransferase, putative [Babesia ovis]|uniref:RNA methyltransferase, putative n=1 Tax=Babesia ovis TaxID=5869 RepID=A0A9W5T9P3_BABOV|nr:RNA methyltransferase, putative [Babesia ovis]
MIPSLTGFRSPLQYQYELLDISIERFPLVISTVLLQLSAEAQGLPHDDTKATQYAFSKHLHICGGAIRGRRLCVPPVYLRPMMNRVKNALFPSLKHMGLFAYGYDCKVIDLFCGSGSVGLEALSYGASHCTFVDLSIQCCKATSINAAHCKFEDKVRIIRADALESISSPWLHSITDKFDLLFACPPYEEVVYKDLMKVCHRHFIFTACQQLANTTILNTNGVVVVEYPREIDYLPWNIEDGKLLGYRNRKYGRTVVAIYCYKPTGSLLESCEKSKDEFVPTTYSRKRLKIEGYIPKENPNNYT